MIKTNSSPEIAEYPTIFWAKFFTKFKDIETLPIKEWKVVHLLAYFSKLYKDHYKVKYSFRFNAPSPTKSYETFQIRKLGQIISADPQILKDYIDWFFENKIILKKKRITSLSFLTDVNVCNEYKFKKLGMDGMQIVDRTTTLPHSILEIANQLNVECKTYGDLAFIKRIVDADTIGNDSDIAFINSISSSGFDLSILDKVK